MTGWIRLRQLAVITGDLEAAVAPLLDMFARVDARDLLEAERGRVLARVIREQVEGEAGSGR